MPFLDDQRFQKVAGSGKAKAPPPPPKGDPIMGDNSSAMQEIGKRWVKKPEVFSATKIPEERRKKQWEEMSKEWGSFIEKGEREKTLRKLGEISAKTTAEQIAKEEKIRLLKESLKK